VFVAGAALMLGFLGWRANQLMSTQVMATIVAEVAGLREQYAAGGLSRLAAVVSERAREPGTSLYLLIDSDGRKLAGNLSRMPDFGQPDAAGGVFHYVRASDPHPGTARLAVGAPIGVPGGAQLVVGRDIEDQRQFVETMRYVALLSIALLSALGICAGLLISRSVLRRIDAVNEASRTIMAGDLSRRIPLDGSADELDRLAENLNAMLARIEELMASLREVSDNIAHDLKTPLNRLRNRAEAALREGPGAYREGLVKTIEEADELIKTFNSLLLIARLEAGAVAESMVLLDPAQIIRDVAELYEPVAEEAGMALSLAVEEGLCVRANRELIGQAVANLVDNAIKHSALGAEGSNAQKAERPVVRVSTQRSGDRIEIAVSDHGPGVAPEDRERALRRFVRLEKSRSRPGSGLGLSLVAAVARLHGGTVRLEDNAPGLRVVLSIPVCARSTGQPTAHAS
jgi:signal transduction histidine kinase